MALPSKTIESMEQIAEKLERWANDKKRHRMLCNALPGLGCRTSLNEPLRGFGTILLKLKCWRPEAAVLLKNSNLFNFNDLCKLRGKHSSNPLVLFIFFVIFRDFTGHTPVTLL